MFKKYILSSLIFMSVVSSALGKTPPDINSSKCYSNPIEMIKTFKEAGFKSLIILDDIQDSTKLHEIVYDMQHDRTMSLTITYQDGTKKTPTNMCVEFVGIHPFGNGPTFKDFILHQRINDFNQARAEYLKEDEDARKKSGNDENGVFDNWNV